jgi:hypothetical protein
MQAKELPHSDDGTLDAYAWPGGYPLYYITADAGCLCPECAEMARREGLTNDRQDTQWYILAAEVNWEDASLYCDNCEERIESAYAEDDNSCDQCCAVMINGTFCHETGCPNARKVKVDGQWRTPDEED